MTTDSAATATTLLFVPGDRPDRFAKAVASGADLVVIDLEDAVATRNKDAARSAVAEWLASPGSPPTAVRVNAAGTPWHDADVRAVKDAAAVVLPKATPGDALEALAATVPVIALVETAAGVLDARQIASTPGVRRVALGSFDLAAELGVDPADALAIAAARSALVLASAAAGLPGPIDGVFGDLADESGLRDETTLVRRLGFTGKLCVHPRQVPVVAGLLTPDEAEVAWATGLLAAIGETNGGTNHDTNHDTDHDADGDTGDEGVAVVEGRMVDKPVIERARRILGRAPSHREVHLRIEESK